MKKNLYRLLLLPLLLAAWGAQAQAPAWLSAYGVPANAVTQQVQAVATNTAGDVFVTGAYTGSVSFGSTTLNSAAGSQDMYVAKWSNSTNSWAWAVSGGGVDADQGLGIAVSSTNVYVTGSFASGTAATISGSALSGTTSGGNDVFVAKYVDGGTTVSNGGALSGGGSNGDAGRAIAVNGTTVYVTGYIGAGAATFGSSSLTGAGQDLFIARYTDSGTLQNGGAIRGGGSSVDRGNGVAVIGTTVYVTGYSNSSSFAFGSSTLTGQGSSDVFLAKATDTGSGLTAGSAVLVGGSGTDRGNAIAVSGSNIYVAGQFTSPSLVFGSTTLTNSDNSGNTDDVFVAKYTDGGTLTAAGALRNGGSGDDQGLGIAASGSTLHVVGNYGGSVTFGPSALTSSGGLDVFVAKYTDASSLTVDGAVSGGSSGGDDYGFGVAASGTQAVAGGSLFATPATFGSYTISTGGGGFISRAGQPTVTVTSITGLTPTPAATSTVSYQVTFSGAVTGLTTSNFNLTNSAGFTTLPSVSSVSGSGSTYTVVVNTGAGDGTLRLNVATSTGVTPSITGLPTTTGTTYTITKSFAAAPTLRIQAAGSASNNGDVTAFVDQVQVLSGGSAVASGLQNGSFETNNVNPGSFKKTADGVVAAPWSFTGLAGVARNGSAFGAPTPPNGDAVGLVQSAGDNNASLSQNLAVPTGTNYQISFQTAQRNYTARDQRLNVFVNNVFVGAIQPTVYTSYEPFTSATFSVTAPALTATVSTTSASPTSTAPIPFSVSFSQSVGTTFTASDVTLTGGSITAGSFAGSGSGPYTFTVTPTGSSIVTVKLNSGVAFDANNTLNTASNFVSVQYDQPQTAAPTLTSPVNGISSNNTPIFSGTAPANSTITLYLNGNPASFPAGNNGTFAAQYASPLADGTYTAYVTAQASGSTVSAPSATVTFTIDRTQPTPTVSSTSSNPTSTAPIPFRVTFDEAVTSFTPSSLTVTNGTVTSFSGSGTTYNLTITPGGTGTVTVRVMASSGAVDAVGNPNAASNLLSIQYNQPVTATPVLSFPANNSFVRTNRPEYRGTAVPGSFIAIYRGGVLTDTTFANGTGNFHKFSNAALADGSYSVYVTATAAGQLPSANSNTNSFTVDTTPPAAPVVFAPANGSVMGSTTPTFVGSAEPNATVTIIVDGSPVTTVTADGSGNWQRRQPTALAQGSHTVRATATDAAGNVSPSSNTNTFIVDTVPPATPVVITPANGSVVSTATPTYTGTAEPNSEVSILIDNVFATFAVTDANGNWSRVQPTALAQGSHTIRAYAMDAAMNLSPTSAANTFTVDTTPPTVALSSSTVANGGSTSTSPVNFTATFSEPVVNFTSAGIQVSGGAVTSGPTAGSGNTYAFQVTPSGAGTVQVRLLANAAQDQAGNNNTASGVYAFTFSMPTITVQPALATLPGGMRGMFYSVTFSAAGGSGSFTYAISGTPPSGLSLSGNTLSGTPTASGTFNFRITATDNSAAPGPYSGFRDYSITVAASVVTMVGWNGSVSTDWFTAANWTPNQVPDATIDVVIPTAPSGNRFPVIAANASAADARNVSIASGASLSMSANALTIRNNLTNNGTFNGFTGSGASATGGTVVVGGSALGLLNGGGINKFWNLFVASNGAQLNNTNSTSVQRLLTLLGNFATNNNPFTLVSDASMTAMVVNNGGVVTGNATVQRYIAPDRNPNLGYRHVAAPINSATIGSLTTGAFSPVVNPAYNSSATPNTVRPFPTVYGYDQSRLATTTNNLPVFDKGWYSPSTTLDPMSVGQGYTALIGAAQTWNFTGGLNNGNVSLNLARNSGATAAAAGLHLIGNPYPSPLDWSLVTTANRTNVDPAIYVWNSDNPANPYSGAYGFYNNGIGTISPVLALGQGFFVRVTQGQTAGTLNLQNSHRPTAYTNPTYRRGTADTRPQVQLALQAVGSTVSDAAFVYFEQGATDAFEPQYDAEKLSNPSGLNLSTSLSATQRLSIDGRAPLGTAQLVVPLAVGVPAVGSYTLAAAQLLNLTGTPTYLRDLQTGAIIDLAQQPSYQFTVSNASALITGRFELVFSPQRPLATASAALAQQVGLYPNPASAKAYVELPASLGRQAVQATLVDAVGREVRTLTLPAQGAVAHPLDLRELPAGVYMLRLSTSAGSIVKKLTVE